jgi:hypothetical protein
MGAAAYSDQVMWQGQQRFLLAPWLELEWVLKDEDTALSE